MNSRKEVKKVESFAKKKWRQTRPKTLEARRVKDEKVKEIGFPLLVLTVKAPVKFVVWAEYSDTLTIFHFNNAGGLLSAKTFEQPFEIKTEIIKKSVRPIIMGEKKFTFSLSKITVDFLKKIYTMLKDQNFQF